MGTGLDQMTMDPKIPTTLWKTQLLKLVNEAPRALCVNYEEDPTRLLDTHNKSGSASSDTSSQSHHSENDDLFTTMGSVPATTPPNGRHPFLPSGTRNGVEKTESCSSVSSGGGNEPLNPSLGATTSSSILDEVDLSSPFGKAFHGYLTHSQTHCLLTKDGHYLIRRRDNEEEFVLSFRFNGHIKNFQITYDDSTDLIFVGDRDKGYRSLQELVQEGLTTLYLDRKAGSYIALMCDLSQFHGNHIVNGSSTLNGHSNFYTSNGHGRMKSASPSPTTSTVSKSSMERLRNPDLRTHSFVIHTFESLPLCQICQNFMWGTSSQGLQCKDCGFSIHEACSDKIISECEPNMSSVKEVFGADLSFMVKAAGGSKPPFVLEKCVTEIEKRGLLIEGIYRVSGSKDLIERLTIRMEKEREMTDLSEYIDVHSMCGLVKRYLRSLPVPLITPDVFERFLNANGPTTLDLLRRNIKKLPRSHQVTLKYLLQHLHRIVEKCEWNRMTSYNLSSVFAPTLICSDADISLNSVKIGTSLLEAMINSVPKLYPQPQQFHIHTS